MVTVFGGSDMGKCRSSNQDCFQIVTLSDGSVLITVCDGMGGVAGGSVASSIAKDTIVSKITQAYNEKMSGRALKSALLSAVAAANIAVFDKAVSDSSLFGMGTTAVAALIRASTLYIAHVGDSRAYIVNSSKEGKIRRITTDHSIVQMMVESGQITEEEARIHPKRNIITRAIGVRDEVSPDLSVINLESGDRLVVCSDGLTNYVHDDEIAKTVSENPPKTAVEMLIDEANSAGGGDNITVAVAHYVE